MAEQTIKEGESKMTLLEELKLLLEKDERLVSEGKLLKNRIVELALKLDKDLIKLLLSNGRIKEHFFKDVDGVLVFDKEKFMKFVDNKEFLPDSYTAFKNRIGLTADKNYIAQSKEVVLSWPYKDCILEGGQEKTDEKRKEIFHNEILAPDEIDRLLDPKVFTNFKRINKDGEHPLDGFRRDPKVNRKRGLPEDTITDNMIIKGNNLLVLHSLLKEFRGKVKLIYIDPPFNTGNDEFKYNDSFNHSTWLTFMRNRLEVARDLLALDGNIFIHIDINESHYLKVLCDEIFGRENFVEEIIWAYGSPSGGRAGGAKPVNIHDYILHYAKDYSNRKQNRVYTPYSEKYIQDWFKYTDEDGRKYQRRMRGKDESGRIIWEKQYLDESKGVPLTTVWTDIKQVYADPRAYKENQARYTELIREFSGQKPESLIKRILEMATDEGDIVLDFCIGTGTTCAVAHKMGRQYIGVEQLDYIEDFAINRIKKVVKGDQTGISKTVNWKGGGDFVACELKELNEKFIQRIQDAKDTKELLKIWEEMKQHAFLSYRVDPKLFDENIEEFKKLPAEEQKKILIECLDANNLYVNYSEMEDKQYGISREDIELNKKFYEGL